MHTLYDFLILFPILMAIAHLPFLIYAHHCLHYPPHPVPNPLEWIHYFFGQFPVFHWLQWSMQNRQQMVLHFQLVRQLQWDWYPTFFLSNKWEPPKRLHWSWPYQSYPATKPSLHDNLQSQNDCYFLHSPILCLLALLFQWQFAWL